MDNVCEIFGLDPIEDEKIETYARDGAEVFSFDPPKWIAGTLLGLNFVALKFNRHKAKTRAENAAAEEAYNMGLNHGFAFGHKSGAAGEPLPAEYVLDEVKLSESEVTDASDVSSAEATYPAGTVSV